MPFNHTARWWTAADRRNPRLIDDWTCAACMYASETVRRFTCKRNWKLVISKVSYCERRHAEFVS
jgi:hypothetical protein